MAAERFVHNEGTISIANGSRTVTGAGTLFAGVDRGGAQLWWVRDDDVPQKIGSVADLPAGERYDNLELTLVSDWNGPDLTGVSYELIDGAALARGASQAAVYARFVAFLQQNAGLVFNSADTVDYSIIPSNSLFVDDVSQRIYQWRGGLLQVVRVVGEQWSPKGPYNAGTTYALNAMVSDGGKVWISNANANTGHTPASSPTWWTEVPLPVPRYDLAIYDTDRPGSGEMIAKWVAPTPTTFRASLVESKAIAEIAATASAVFSIRKNGVQFATLTFGAASAIGVFVCTSDAAFVAGDVLTVIAPNPRDATLSGVAATIVSYRV